MSKTNLTTVQVTKETHTLIVRLAGLLQSTSGLDYTMGDAVKDAVERRLDELLRESALKKFKKEVETKDATRS